MAERWPDLAALELLVAVDEHGGVGAAARAVGMAQPNASRAIARIERDLGFALLDRHPRGSRLTDEGTVIVDWSRRLLSEARVFRGAMAAMQAGRRAQLDVVASLTVAEHLAPSWIAALHRRVTSVDVRLRVANSREVFELVRAGTCALGFVESPEIDPALARVEVARDRLALVVAPGHPWAQRSAIGIDELAATPLVVREGGSGTRARLAEALSGYELAQPALELGSNAAVKLGVAGGAGPAVLSELAVAGAIALGELVEVRLDGPELWRGIHAVWLPTAPPTGAAADLVLLARAEGRRRSAGPDQGAPAVSRSGRRTARSASNR